MQFRGAANPAKSLEKAVSADKVEGFSEVDERNVSGPVLLSALFL